MNETVSIGALSQSSDFDSGKKCEGGVLQIQKKPRRNTYRGFFPMSTWPGAGLTQATRNTSTQEDAHKVGKKPVVPNHSLDVRYWHKADMLNALTNVRFWRQSGPVANRYLPISIYEYTA